jgi:hypothetical protein
MNECEHGEPKGADYCGICRYQIRHEQERKLAAALAAKQTWVDAAACFIINKVFNGETVTADTLIDAVGLPAGEVATNHNNAIGALFNRMARQGAIAEVGRVRSTRPSNMGRKISVWGRNPERLKRG